ncbi:hypothetical protein CGC20_1050 [Leishmania donovani]|uniref:WW domain-containing protein n=1 Tax=Leishmania donovani TaxID=5661 RepID=A0A504Y4U7_LEIDO|nr:hypothetical protein CGC20_1050 [Leishmania donovani]TPP52467.1 hypothetical protein CGC21_10290 [Leishmania donovani]
MPSSAAPSPTPGGTHLEDAGSAEPAAVPSSSPTSSSSSAGFSHWWQRLYSAHTFAEGLRVVFEVVPLWVPVAGVITTAGTYYVTFRVRLFLAQWRIAERRRAERKYELLDNLRGMKIVPVGADLMAIVERMLMSDTLPDGWVLYRTSAGIVRFMNLNTQELFFFPPNKRKEKALIESELKKRNREAMESRYNFSYEDEGMNSSSLSPSRSDTQNFETSHRSAREDGGTAGGNASPIDFDDGAGAEDPNDGLSSTFRRVFSYFLEREQKKIEQGVALARSSREGSVLGGPSAGPSSAFLGGTGSGQGSGSGAGGASGVAGGGHDGATASHRTSASMTYRVVSSSSIHGGRSGNN